MIHKTSTPIEQSSQSDMTTVWTLEDGRRPSPLSSSVIFPLGLGRGLCRGYLAPPVAMASCRARIYLAHSMMARAGLELVGCGSASECLECDEQPFYFLSFLLGVSDTEAGFTKSIKSCSCVSIQIAPYLEFYGPFEQAYCVRSASPHKSR